MAFWKSGLAAAALITTVAVSSIAPAQAQSMSFGFGQRDRVVTTYCDRHPSDRDCHNYHNGSWHDKDYNNFYGSHRSDLDGVSAGLFGLGFAAILGSAIAGSNNHQPVYGGDHVVGYAGQRDRVVGVYGNDHVQACSNRYGSYDVNSDTYLGYDGFRHDCQL